MSSKITNRLTTHAELRRLQRKIPESLIAEAVEHGKRTVILDRQAYQYRLKNILGLRGTNLIVIQGFDGSIITSYVEKITPKHQRL